MDIEELLIEENCTVLEAMERLGIAAKKILFVHRDGKLVAALTDGDIRRWILAGGGLDESVDKVANYSLKYLYERDGQSARRFMREHNIEALPIVDAGLQIQRIVFMDDRELARKREKLEIPVVMMAGGLGTRLYPYTKILPKALIPIGEIPIAEHIVNHFFGFGCREFHMVVNHKKNMIKAYFNEIDKDYSVAYEDEDIPLGTGGGLSLLKGKIASTFILTNCDILILEDFAKIYRHHKTEGNLITMICSLKQFPVPYGVVEIADDGTIENMQEKPRLSFFVNTGCYLVEPRVVEELEDQTEIGFPTIVEKYKEQGEKIGVYPIDEHAWLDMGQMDELEKMRKVLENK